ncbi:cytochrome P450 [Streptomyces virginiae]|uniref:cytochrome P450 n=1 Tax=Streptomyces virginiae TaxID=1961 RepID=UPI00382F72FC
MWLVSAKELVSVGAQAQSGEPVMPEDRPGITHSRLMRFWMDPAYMAIRLGQAGPVVRVKAGPTAAFQVNDDSLMRKVGCREESFAFWGTDPSLREMAGDGLLGAEGQVHRARRAAMSPAFTASRLAGFGAGVRTVTEHLLDRLPADRPADMCFEMTRLACGLIIGCILRSEISPQSLSSLAAARTALSTGTVWHLALSPWPWMPVPRRRGFRRALALLDQVGQEVMSRHRPDEDGLDVVSQLALVSHGHPHAARHDVRTLIHAGMENVAATLAWACYELGRHPHHQQALREEAQAVLGEERDPVLLRPDRLPLAAAFVTEVMRLHGPPFLFRHARHAMDLGGVRLPERAVVTMPVGALRRDPARYPQSDVFDPLRWMPGAEPRVSPGGLLAYGLGPRHCPGAAAADIMLPVALATLVSSRALRTARRGQRVRVGMDIVPMPRGLTMTAAIRHPEPHATGTGPTHAHTDVSPHS